jgi:hypothetical protein
MSSGPNPLNEILNEIRSELNNQISLVKNLDKKIDTKMLGEQSNILSKIIPTSKISEENKKMLQKFSLTLHEVMDAKSLRYEKQDLERILSNLSN